MLQALQKSSADSLEACILECPAGLQALVEVLRDPREEVRNEVILFLGQVRGWGCFFFGRKFVGCADLQYDSHLTHACFTCRVSQHSLVYVDKVCSVSGSILQ